MLVNSLTFIFLCITIGRLEGKPSLLPKPRRPASSDRLSTEARRPSAARHRSSSAEPARGTIGARPSREASATKLPLNVVWSDYSTILNTNSNMSWEKEIIQMNLTQVLVWIIQLNKFLILFVFIYLETISLFYELTKLSCKELNGIPFFLDSLSRLVVLVVETCKPLYYINSSSIETFFTLISIL